MSGDTVTDKTTTHGYGVLDCPGNKMWIGDDYCDSDLNNQNCLYDGGDCCSTPACEQEIGK